MTGMSFSFFSARMTCGVCFNSHPRPARGKTKKRRMGKLLAIYLSCIKQKGVKMYKELELWKLMEKLSEILKSTINPNATECGGDFKEFECNIPNEHGIMRGVDNLLKHMKGAG